MEKMAIILMSAVAKNSQKSTRTDLSALKEYMTTQKKYLLRELENMKEGTEY